MTLPGGLITRKVLLEPRHITRGSSQAQTVGWSFGANSFLVEKAIRRCVDHVRTAMDQAVADGSPVAEGELRSALSVAVRQSVARYDGVEFDAPYDATDGFMRFGNQGIRIDDVVDFFMSACKVRRVCA